MIDIHLQSQLRERFNSDGSNLRKQQLRMLEMLLYIDRICSENNIKYWLSSGTLLGAVRHGGFIPWDDDLDIEMLREDYVRFLKVFPNNDKYALQTNRTDPNYFYNYAKVRDLRSQISEFDIDKYYKYRGLFVDVFVVERIPLLISRIYCRVFGLISTWGYKYVNNKIIWSIVKLLQKVALFTTSLVRPFSNMMTKDLHHSYGTYFYKERHIEDIFPLKNIEFEGYLFPAPQKPDNYLKIIYGNYYDIPDLDSISIHTSSCDLRD